MPLPISLLSDIQAPRTGEEGEGTGDVETERNAKERTADRRHPEGCLCGRGPECRAEVGAAVEVGGGEWMPSVAQFHKERRESGSSLGVELSALQHSVPLVLEIPQQRLHGQLS